MILDGPYVEICFQEVDPPPVTKTPLHLDVVTDDRGAEVRRLVGLGASIRQQFETQTWIEIPRATTSASSTCSPERGAASALFETKSPYGR